MIVRSGYRHNDTQLVPERGELNVNSVEKHQELNKG